MRYAAICALALALCASVAAAQEPTPSEAASFYVKAMPATPVADPLVNADRDADGSINWEEFRNLLTRAFHVVDRDGDGVLAGGEIDELFVGLNKGEVDRADANKDGKIQYREFVAYTARVFLLSDVDLNGTLTPKELIEGAKQLEGAAKGEKK